MEGARRFLLQPEVLELRLFPERHFHHRVVQIDAVAECDLDERKARPRAEGKTVPGMERHGIARLAHADAEQDQCPAVGAGGDGDDGAVLGQHGVERLERPRIGRAIQRGLGRERGHMNAPWQPGLRYPEPPVGEDEEWPVGRRCARQQRTHRILLRGSFSEEGALERAKIGEAPGLVARVGKAARAERSRRAPARLGRPGKALRQPLVARGEALRGLLESSAHAASAASPA